MINAESNKLNSLLTATDIEILRNIWNSILNECEVTAKNLNGRFGDDKMMSKSVKSIIQLLPTYHCDISMLLKERSFTFESNPCCEFERFGYFQTNALLKHIFNAVGILDDRFAFCLE